MLSFQNQFLIELKISKITYRNQFHQLATCHIWHTLCPLTKISLIFLYEILLHYFIAKNSKIFDCRWKYSPTKFSKKMYFQKWFPRGFIFTLKFTGCGNKSNNSTFFSCYSLKKRWNSRLLLSSATIMYENFLINYRNITKLIIVKILWNKNNEMNEINA